MQNYKVKVQNHSEGMEAQDLFLKMGYEKGVCSTGGYPALIIATPESRFQKTPYSSRATSLNHEAHSQYKEITLPELRAMVSVQKYEELAKKYDGVKTKQLPNGIQFKKSKTSVTIYPSTGTIVSDVCGKINVLKKAGIGKLDHEMNKHFSVITPKQKEYLVKTDTGYTLQVLSNLVDGHDGVIQVPEGSNIAWKDNSNGFVFFTKMEMGYRDAAVIWQRESLNDQVASEEQARQEQTQTREISECDLIDSGKLIIGGLGESFPAGLEHHKFIQPEGFSEGGFIPKQNHGAPVGLLHHGFSGFTQPEELPFVGDTQQTLNERQSQYGDFKDVAEMTQGLLFVMEQYGYKDMPDMHKEALHMICSKMARIVNGDHNHLDSWHDIGGYAKLIENNIK